MPSNSDCEEYPDSADDSSESAHSQVASGSAVIILGTVIGLVLGFLARTIPARLLGPNQYGLLMLAWAIVSTLGFAAKLGFTDGITRHIPRAESKAGKSGVFLTALSITLPWSLFLAAGLFLFAEFIANRIFGDPSLVDLIQVFSFVLPVVTFQSMIVALFRGNKRAWERVIVKDLLNPGLRTIFIIAAIISGFAVQGAAVGWVMGTGVATLVAIYLLYRTTSLVPVPDSHLRHRELFLFSVPLMISGVMGLVLNFGDNLLVGIFLTSTDVGLYDAAFMIGSLITTGLTAFSYLFLPVFSELHKEDKIEEMNQLYTAVTKWIVSTTLPVFLVVVLFSETILRFIFGNAYTAGSLALSVVAVGFFVNVIVGLCVQALVSIGATNFIMIANIGAALTNLILNTILIPTFGLVGAAVASAVTYAAYNLAYTYKLYKETGIVPFSSSLLSPVVATTFATITFKILFFKNTIPFWLLCVFSVIIGICYIISYVVLGGISESDIDLINIIEAKSGWDLNGLKAFLRSRIE